MIRRFISLVIFTLTIGMASFGQDVFGRNDLIAWGHYIQKDGPKQVEIAWNKTDKMLADLAPKAGTAQISMCTLDDLSWSFRLYNS